MSSSVRESLLKLVQYVRKNYKEELELEVRVGQYTTDSLDFISGYAHEHLKVVNRLIQRIEKNTQVLHDTWTVADQKHMLIRCDYANNIRKTCRDQHEEEYMEKKRIFKLDLLSNRQYHIRVAVSRETKLKEIPVSLTKEAPKSVRYLLRASFKERIPSFATQFPELEFRYDLSKVSESAKNKQKAAERPCAYHVELELLTRLLPIENKELEAQQDLLITDMIIVRMQAILGGYKIDEAGNNTPLPPASFKIFSKDF